jgi:hypothetical protein
MTNLITPAVLAPAYVVHAPLLHDTRTQVRVRGSHHGSTSTHRPYGQLPSPSPSLVALALDARY